MARHARRIGRIPLADPFAAVQIARMAYDAGTMAPDDDANDPNAAPHAERRLVLLGEARVLLGGQTWTGRAAQSRRLSILAVLALSPGRRASRQSIQALLWPDADLESARKNLNEAVYVIRRELGADTLDSQGAYLTLGARVATDVDAFRAAQSRGAWEVAVGHYGGAFLGSWLPEDMPEFEPWATREREVLARQHRECLAHLARSAEAAGDVQQAAAWCEQRLAVDPLSIQVATDLVRLLVAAGEPPRASRVIDAMETVWRTELGEELPASFAGLRDQLAKASAGVDVQLDVKSDALKPRTVKHPVSVHARTDARAWRPAWRHVVFALGAAVAIVAVVLGAQYVGRARATPPNQLAILPFVFTSADSSDAFIATGLDDAVTGALGALTGLRVITPNAIAPEGGPRPSLAAIDARYASPLVLDGSVDVTRREVTVTVRVMASHSGEEVGSVLETVPRDDLTALRQTLVARVAVAVRKQLGKANEREVYDVWTRLGKATPTSVALAWRAQHHIREIADVRLAPTTDATVRRAARDRARTVMRIADSLLQDASRASPQWAEPHILRATLAWEMGRVEESDARRVIAERGMPHATNALALLDSSARLADVAVGAAPLADRLRNVLRARAHHARGALRMQASVASATWRSEHAAIERAQHDFEQAVALDSMMSPAWAALARPRWMRADFAGALTAAQTGVRVDPYGQSLEESLVWSARSAAALGDRDATMRWCRRGRAEVISAWRFLDCELLAHALDAAGLGARPDTAAVWALVDTLEALEATASQSGGGYSPVYRRLVAASVSAAVGDTVRARKELQRADSTVVGNASSSIDILYDKAFLLAVLGDANGARAALREYGVARPDYAFAVTQVAKFRVLRR